MPELPYDAEAEAISLGCALLDNDTIPSILLTLRDRDYYLESHRAIYRAIERLYNDQTPVDLVTLTDALRTSGDIERVGPSYLVGMVDNVPTAAYVDSYCDIVARKSRHRDAIAAAEKFLQDAYDEKDLDKAVEDFSHKAVTILRVNERADEAEDAVLADALKFADGSAFIPTGFPSLDRMLGGYPRGDLTYIGARNSHGKTAFFHQTIPAVIDYYRAEQEAAGLPADAWALVLSPDQHPTQIRALEASRVCGISLSYLRERDAHGNMVATEDERELFRQALYYVRAEVAPRVRIRKGSINEAALKTETLAALRGGAKMIAVDTIQRVGAASGNSLDTIGHVSGFLKDMAGDFDVPIVALSQVNRSVDDRDPDKGDGKKPHAGDLSDAPTVIGNDAAAILLLYNNSRYFEEFTEVVSLQVNVAKNKSGAAGGWAGNSVSLGFQREFALVSCPTRPRRVMRGQGLSYL